MSDHSSRANDSVRGPVLDRRGFLRYVGAGATLVMSGSLGSFMGCAVPHARGAWTRADGSPDWQPPPYPVPLPGDPQPSSEDAVRLATYEVHDQLLLPEGFRYDVIAQWGDRFGDPSAPVTFGYNNDYTGLFPIEGSDDEYWLFVNHEYVSVRPWLASEGEDGVEHPVLELRASEDPSFKYGHFTIDGWGHEGNVFDLDSASPGEEIPDAVRDHMRRLSDLHLAAQGVSVLRVRRDPAGRFQVVAPAPDHRRIATQSTENIALDAEGQPPFRFTGPATPLFDELPQGTFCNCSGGTTPWGTFLTCEENIQDQTHDQVSPEGTLPSDARNWFGARASRVNGVVDDSIPEPPGLMGTGHAASRPLDGRAYGWVCEIDPTTGALDKHTALGRFRHENVALRVEKGRRLAAYMGDDRRGGHVWKFVSDQAADDPSDSATAALLTSGTLYAARFEEDFTGRWVPIEPDTPLRRPEPEHCPTGHAKVPARPDGGFVSVGDTNLDDPALEVEDWQSAVEDFAGKPFAQCTLGDLVRPASTGDPAADRERVRGVLVMDAFAMANAAGGTPTARPEDLEVHPVDKSVYIAFTDATDSSDGSPDMRIFPDSRRANSRQYGAIYRLVEDGDDPAAETFAWGRFVSAGEVAEAGGGFANADNLAFDPAGNLWMVTDITTTSQNFPVEREVTSGTQPGGKQFTGLFGNNAMFMIPTKGPDAGVPKLFAIGPEGSELCGPTFTEDGRTLILSVQHPGEVSGPRRREAASETRSMIVHDRDDQPFTQERSVPLGSNFPSGELDRAPRPCVVCITREG